MAETIVLEAEPRTVTGKKVKQLRAADLIPAVVYGPTQEVPLHIQAPRRALRASLRAAGATNLIEMHIGGESFNVLVRDVQRDIIRGDVMHVDFYAVAMDVKIRTEVPISIVGEPSIVTNGEAILITGFDTIVIECLPGNIPNSLEIDVSDMEEIGLSMTVADLNPPEGVEILADPNDILIRTDYATSLEEEEEEEGDELLEEFDAEDVEVIARGKEDEEDEDY